MTDRRPGQKRAVVTDGTGQRLADVYFEEEPGRRFGGQAGSDMKSAKVYPPVGFCIYCGSTEPPLGKEHILAYGLGGKL